MTPMGSPTLVASPEIRLLPQYTLETAGILPDFISSALWGILAVGVLFAPTAQLDVLIEEKA